MRYRSDSRTIVPRTKSAAALEKLGPSMPKQILGIAEPAQEAHQWPTPARALQPAYQ